MAHQVVWLRSALRDIDGIASYISGDSERYAGVVVERIIASARELARRPWIGRRVPEWDDDRWRQRIIYSYRLIYRVDDKHVVILAVIHGARLMPDDVRWRTR